MIDDYTNQTAWHETKTGGRTAAGEPAWTSSAAVPCRQQHKQILVKGAGGQTAVSQVQLFVSASLAVAIKDRFALEPGGQPYEVLSVRHLHSLDSPAYKIVILGG